MDTGVTQQATLMSPPTQASQNAHHTTSHSLPPIVTPLADDSLPSCDGQVRSGLPVTRGQAKTGGNGIQIFQNPTMPKRVRQPRLLSGKGTKQIVVFLSFVNCLCSFEIKNPK